jgi:hypothetical protein
VRPMSASTRATKAPTSATTKLAQRGSAGREKPAASAGLLDYLERVKVAVWATVKRPFHIIDRRFGLMKLLANLLIARRLLEQNAQGAL